jgi:lysyl-tRNA synthetase class I
MVNSRAKTKEEKEIASKLLKSLEENLGSKNWENENFLAALKKFSKNENIPFKQIYFLLTGKEHGIGLLELNDIYGKEFFINNLKGK